jgi:pilus assembly protein CpaE
VSTQAAVVANDAIYGSWLKDKLGNGVKLSRIKFEETSQASLQRLEELEQVDLLMVEFDAARLQRSVELVEGFLDRYPDIPVIALGNKVESSTLLRAMRAGASDFLDLSDKDEADVPSRIGRVMRRAAQTTAGTKVQGQIFVVLSGTPSEGVAFLAAHLALAIMQQAESAQRILLLDASFPPGSALVFLNVTQEYNLADSLADVQRCDQTLIDTAFARHSSGIYLLSQAEDQLSQISISVQQFEALLTTLRLYFSHIVVAADAVLPLPALAVLVDQAARTLLVSDQSVLRSRQNRQWLHALDFAGINVERVALIVDHYQRKLGLEPDKLAALLKIPLLAAFTVTPSTRAESMNTGESLFKLAPKDPYAVDVKRLAAELLKQAQEDGQEDQPGLLSRLFR